MSPTAGSPCFSTSSAIAGTSWARLVVAETRARPATRRLRTRRAGVIPVVVGRSGSGNGAAPAAVLSAARVVGDDRAVGEVGRQRRDAGGAHRRADHHEDRPASGLAL